MDGYISTNSSKLTPIGDGAALLKPSARWVNAPAPDSSYHAIQIFSWDFIFKCWIFSNTPRPCFKNPKSWKVHWFPSCGYFSQSPHAQHLKGVNLVKSFQSRFLKGEGNGKDSTIWMSVTLNVCQGSTILMLSAHNISIKVLIYRANEKQHSKLKHRVEDAQNFALSKIRQGSCKALL